MKYLLIVFGFFLMSCSSAKVITDFDDKTDFEKFKTYGFYENVGKDLNDLDIKRILKIIDTTLQQKGLTFSETPDFFIDFNIEKSAEVARNTVAVGFGNAGPNSIFGVSGGIPIGSKKIREVLTIEFLTPIKEELFWKASLESTVKEKRLPQEKEVYFQLIVPKVLSKYPPK
ncbi:DUF4136 domain-containing protein [Polaribacter gangjinensis]|uniref:DUF4136 domain-containing protein n=1 Tax=Polaribacter gangjinensis TaxID=574710 RepID=A0A2S7WBJ1_9FLAO|nr:DUF4136 domain-containing protein [Polaribacter gangjinensis]PQJ74998.1 hypothetical protein BTO13_06935 [Polaribacter gangjinensis]